MTIMKFRIKLLVVGGVVLLFNSCKQKPTVAQPYPTTKNIVRLTDKNMPAVEYYSVEKVTTLPEEYAYAEYHIYNDSIAIIVNDRHPQPYIVTFYNLNTKKEIAGYFKKGSGPDELISAAGEMHRNYLVLRDGTAHATTRLNIDSVLAENSAYKPVITRVAGLTIGCVYIGKDTITMTNPMYINDGFGVEGLPEFIQYDAKTGKLLADYKLNDKNFPPNLTQRTLAYCNSKYMAFWYCYPIITIYDKNFNLIKMYRDDKFNDPAIRHIEQNSELLTDEFTDFFLFSCQTDNFVFVTNGRGFIPRAEITRNGGFKWMQSPDFTLYRFKNQEIWCFDNDINLVRRFKCSDTIGFIRSVSYNEKSGTLYINAMDEDEEYCLFRCKIEK